LAETLPVALLIGRESAGFAHGLALAALVPKQGDTMPAMVGALLGAASRACQLPWSWRDPVDELRGICVPSTKGVRLRGLASALLAAGEGTDAVTAGRAID
jgi:hypothetical protein